MRRLVAIPLLLLMLAAFLAPAALATVTKPMPACCRAGAHHCATLVPRRGETQVKGQCCPYRKHLAFSVSAATPAARQGIAPAAAHSFLNDYYSEVFISHRESPHSQRGPPIPQ